MYRTLLLYLLYVLSVTLENCRQQDGGAVWESCGVFAAIMVGCLCLLCILLVSDGVYNVYQ